MLEKTDFKKQLDSYRGKAGEFRLIEVPRMQYLMIDGAADPNTDPRYASALEALYPVAYKLKFASKRELAWDYVVPPLEGLWWSDDMSTFTTSRDKSRWQWTMMIMVPEWIERGLVEHAIALVESTSSPARLPDLRFETLDEGLCAQTLHVGSFDDEGPVLERMHHGFVPEHGMELTGKHHEVYFSDVRKVAPARLRTLLRQPVRPRASG